MEIETTTEVKMKLKHCIFIIYIFGILVLYSQESDTPIHTNTFGRFIKLDIDTANSCRIYWGNGTKLNVSKNRYPVLGEGTLIVIDELETWVVLLQNCGQRSKNIVLLPLKSDTSEIVFENVVGYDSINKKILYLSRASDSKNIEITTYDLASQRTSTILFPDFCTAVNPIECITDIRYGDNIFFISYYEENDKTLQEKAVVYID